MAFWEFVGTAVGGIVGGAAIVGAAIKWGADGWLARRLEDYKASLNKEMDNHRHELESFADRRRLLLKREELMFDQELKAIIEFMKIADDILPKSWRYDDDWYAAQSQIAMNLGKFQMRLQEFMKLNSVALSAPAREFIKKAIVEANDGSKIMDDDSDGDNFDYDPSPEACQCVDDFFAAMKSAEEQLRNDLKHGSFSA